MGEGARQGFAGDVLRQESAQTDDGVDQGISQRGRAGVDVGHDDHAQILRFGGQVGAAFDAHRNGHTAHAEVAGGGDAAGHVHVGVDLVESEAGREQVAEIEGEAARQALQTEHAQQLGDAGVGLEKLALPELQIELPVQAGKVQTQRRAQPGQVAADVALAAFEQARFAQGGEQAAGVKDVELELHGRAPCGRGGIGAAGHGELRAHGGPGAAAGEHAAGRGELEVSELPHLAVIDPAAVDGLYFETGEMVAVQIDVVGHDVQRGNALGLFVEQVFHVGVA